MGRRLLAVLLGTALPVLVQAGDKLPADLEPLEKSFKESRKPRKEAYLDARPQFEKYAAEHAGTEEGLQARLWVLQNTWWLKDDKGAMEDEAAKIADGILKDYPKSDGLARLAEWNYVFRKEKHAELLEALAAPEQPAAVRAATALARAIRLHRAGETDKARPVLESIVENFGEIKRGYTTYGAIAGAYLNVHDPDDLAIGKPAPEISGVSPDGKPMKLSDYNGRVVVIDFFGDW
ncbi:MAG: hypothetical protein IT452_19180 [Planctomycetia bacterium]|nr:hypothetical protein [Planctomycetia bacterium]